MKKLFVNTGRSLEGYYPLGDKIDVSGSVRDLSGNNFHGRIRDQNKNIITSITAQQNYEKKSNRSSYFGRDRFVEVDYQAKLNPNKFTLLGWIKPNNSLDTMEGILSSEFSSSSSSIGSSGKGYGLYRWIYRSYKLKNSTSSDTTVRSSQKLVNRDGAQLDSAQGQGDCLQESYKPPLPLSAGPDKCDSVNSSGNCNDRDYKHTFAWSGFGPYENPTTITCREVHSVNTFFEFWSRPSAGTFDTSGTGLNKANSSIGFIEQTGYDLNKVAKILRSYDRTNADDSAIQQSKLTLSGGAANTFPYNIENKDVNNWIMFIATWDGTQQKIQLRNYFDVVNDPGKGNSPAKASTYNPVTNSSSKLYIGNGYGDGKGYPGDYKLNLFQGNIDDVRIYSRVISEDEIDTIFNLSDSEPPVPGNQGTVTKSGTCSLSWSAAEDDVTSTSNLEYKVVGITGSNRITTVESALINDTLNNSWIQGTSATVSGLGGGYVDVSVSDEGENMSLYGGSFCP